MEDDPSPAATKIGNSVVRSAARRILDPVDRASEVLFGLIMVLTFTLSLGTTEAGRGDVRAVLIGALGCNFAWAIIDAVMYLMGAHGERGMAASTLKAIREAESAAAGRAIVADHLPPAILPALAAADLERIRLHLNTLPPDSLQPRIGREDYLGALGVFLLVFLCLFPIVLPFLFLNDIALALKISNVIAVAMLFLTGFTFGLSVGRPWRSGFSMVAIGVALVALATALGG